MSLSIKDTLAKLSTPPSTNLSSNAAYQRVASPNFMPSAIVYIDGNQLRRALESAILPTLSSGARSRYQNYVLPWIGPVGTTPDRKISMTNLYVDIH